MRFDHRQLEKLQKAYHAFGPGADDVLRARRRFEDKLALYRSQYSVPEIQRGAWRLFPLTLRPVGVLLGIFVIALAGVSTSSAFSNAVPGDLFYGFKRAGERAQLSFALDPSRRAELGVEFAGRRLEEVSRIAESSEPDREERLSAAVDEFKAQITTVEQNLETLRQAPRPRTAEVAKIIDRKATEYSAVLEQTTSQVSGEVAEKVLEAKDAAHEASVKAVTMLFEGQRTGQVSLGDVRHNVGEKLRELEGALHLVALRLVAIPDGSYPEVEAIGGPRLQALIAELAEARKVLGRAKDLFAHGGYEAALREYREGIGVLNQLEWGVGLYEHVLEVRKQPEQSSQSSDAAGQAEIVTTSS